MTDRALIAFHSNDTRRTDGALLALRTGFARRAIRTRRTRGSMCAVKPVLTRRSCLAPEKKKPNPHMPVILYMFDTQEGI